MISHSESIAKLAAAYCKASAAQDSHAEAVLVKQVVALTRKHSNKKAVSVTDAFMSRVAFGSTDCWYWVGARSDIGYGTLTSAREHYGLGELMAHRIAWSLFNGPIPAGLKVLHKCDVRSCVNPDHLFLGTQRDNVQDMFTKGRDNHARPYGDRNPMARLTNETVAALRSDYATGAYSQHQLAKTYGVSVMTINRAVRGISWRAR